MVVDRSVWGHPHSPPHRVSLIALLLVLVLGVIPASAQTTTPVCPDPPDDPLASGQRIACTEDATSTTDIDIDAEGVDIDTTADNEPGIGAMHAGDADIDVTVGVKISQENEVTTSDIDTTGGSAHGIRGEHAGTGDIDIDVRITDITTTGVDSHGVFGRHAGTGDIEIDILASTIDVRAGGNEKGIYARHDGDGDIDILVNHMTTNAGIFAEHFGSGDSTVSVDGSNIDSDQNSGISNQHVFSVGDPPKTGRSDSHTYVTGTKIILRGNSSEAITGIISGNHPEGDLLVDVTDTIIKTTGTGIRGRNRADVGNVSVNVRGASEIDSARYGIEAWREEGGRGALNLDVRDTKITTRERVRVGIYLRHESKNAMTGDVLKAYIENSTITTKGLAGHGIYALRYSDGNIDIDTRNVAIVTESTDLHRTFNDTFAVGVSARHAAQGNIYIDLQDGSIETRGTYSYGVYGLHRTIGKGGEVSIQTRGGNTITTTGDNADGILVYHFGTMQETSRISIDVGGTVDAQGANAFGVRVGALSSGNAVRVAAFDDEGYRKQTVTVNGSVVGNAAGVFLAGGGRVVIGPRGSIGATSGIAILATGDTPGANPGDPVIIKPKLRVDMNLGGRKVAQAIGENVENCENCANWIINDGGGTTIYVNNVELHNAETGVTGRRASKTGRGTSA